MAFKTRVEFTKAICSLLSEMIADGEQVIIDYALRSREEQKRLFEKGLSKCDGEVKRSSHQSGKAIDLYFVGNEKLVPPQKGFEFWHKRWEELGGDPEISWDRGHFE